MSFLVSNIGILFNIYDLLSRFDDTDHGWDFNNPILSINFCTKGYTKNEGHYLSRRIRDTSLSNN